MKSTIENRQLTIRKTARSLALGVRIAALGVCCVPVFAQQPASCSFLEGYCFSGVELVGVLSDYMDGPGVPLENDLVEIEFYRTMHFYGECPGGLGCTQGQPTQSFACSLPASPPYSCFAADTWTLPTDRLDVDRDGDLDLRDVAALQNEQFNP